MEFTKMHGIGNDFVLLNHVPEGNIASFSKAVCDRRTGVGADGLLLVTPDKGMRMFNPDGSESEMCGNGLRAFALFLRDQSLVTENSFTVETGAGALPVQILENDQVQVDMGRAKLSPTEIGMSVEGESFINQNVGAGFFGTAVSMGNPHLVIFCEDVTQIELEKLGPAYENYALFPNRTNVHFVQVLDRTHLNMRTWERGAGITLACGTGACSVAVAGLINGLSEREVEIELPGGKLNLKYEETGHVLMTGPAQTVFTGNLSSFFEELL